MSERLQRVQKEGVPHTMSRSFESDVLTSKVPVVVDFYADWCGPCRIVAPIIENLAKEFDGKVRFAKLNVDENEDLAVKYGVMSIPTMIFFSGGNEVNRLVGAASKDYYRQLINRLLDGEK